MEPTASGSWLVPHRMGKGHVSVPVMPGPPPTPLQRPWAAGNIGASATLKALILVTSVKLLTHSGFL